MSGAAGARNRLEEGQRVRFGVGLRHEVPAEVRRLGCRRVLLLATPRQADLKADMMRGLGASAAGSFMGAAMHTPVGVTGEALEALRSARADCLLAVGGGSVIGLGKALAWRSGLPQIVLPTTYSGSEVTPVLGQTENGVKTTFSDPKVRPEVVLYDPELVTTLPVDVTVASGLNAMAHAVEALYTEDRTEATTALALSGLAALVRGLPEVLADPGDTEARLRTLRGASACGRMLGLVRMGLHHKLCHLLGGTFGLPHAQTHAVILPHAVAYNARSAGEELGPLADLLEDGPAGQALHGFAKRLKAPLALRDLGMAEADLDRAAALGAEVPFPNPHPVTRDGLRALLQAAWSGDPPVH